MFPDGDAARLLSQLQMPCAHCGGAFHEPLTMAAKRHRRDPRAVLEAFRALERRRPDRGRGPGSARAGSQVARLASRFVKDALSEPERNGSSRDLGLGVARRRDRSDDCVAIAQRDSLEFVLGELDTPALAVVADAEHAIAQRLHGELGTVDLREDLRIDRGSIRDAARRGTGEAGFSALGTPSSRASSRTSSLPTPASSSGWTTPCSAARVRPGRQSPTSSAFAPESTAA